MVQSQQGLPPLGELNIPEKQKSPDLDLPVLDTKKDQIQDPVLRVTFYLLLLMWFLHLFSPFVRVTHTCQFGYLNL